ncbi:hypothetical protein ACE6H2_009586 [Prunus campanulata]
MIVFLVSQVQAQSITCLLKCMLFCHCVKASTICTGLCLKACKKTLPGPLYYCNLCCTTSICTNLSPGIDILKKYMLDNVEHWIPHKELQNARGFDLNGPVLGGRPAGKLHQASLNHELFS